MKILSAFPESRKWKFNQWKTNALDYKMNQKIQESPLQYVPWEIRGQQPSYNVPACQIDYGEPMDIDDFSR